MADLYTIAVLEVNGVELEVSTEVDLVPSIIPFSDPTFVADNVQDALVEAKSLNFSYHVTSIEVTIPTDQTMVVPQLELDQELILDGELYLI